MEENRIPKRVLYMNLETRRPRGIPRNRWQDEVRDDGRMVGGEEWQEKIYDREEWKKLLRTARKRRILHMPMEQNRIILVMFVTCNFLLSLIDSDTTDGRNNARETKIWCAATYIFQEDPSLGGSFFFLQNLE
jgi:hypothetical protein